MDSHQKDFLKSLAKIWFSMRYTRKEYVTQELRMNEDNNAFNRALDNPLIFLLNDTLTLNRISFFPLLTLIGKERMIELMFQLGVAVQNYNTFEILDLAFLLSKFSAEIIYPPDIVFYFSNLEYNQILKVMGIPTLNKTSFLFMLLTGYCSDRSINVSNISYIEKLEKVNIELLEKLYWARYEHHKPCKDQANMGIYRFMAVTEKLNIEPYIIALGEGRIDEIGEALGIIFPNRDSRKKHEYFLKSINYYSYVVEKKGPKPKPKMLSQLKEGTNTLKYLSHYTDKQLVDWYEVEVQGYSPSRFSLLFDIEQKEKYNLYPWSWNINHSKNDNTFNIASNELRKDIDKKRELTISIGGLKDYKSYQIEELIACIITEDNVSTGGKDYHFIVPDGQPGDEFTPNDMFMLKKMLSNPPNWVKGNNLELVRELFNKIPNFEPYQLNQIAFTLKTFDNLKSMEKRKIKIYLVWLFFLGHWIRFWEGPQEPFPKFFPKKPDQKQNEIRFQRVEIQYYVRTELLSYLGSKLEKIIELLPVLDIKNDKIVERNDKLSNVIVSSMAGHSCHAIAADIILRSSYFYLKFIEKGNISKIITKYWFKVCRFERRILKRQIPILQERKSPKLPIWKKRLVSINNKTPLLENDFQYYYTEKTPHLDNVNI